MGSGSRQKVSRSVQPRHESSRIFSGSRELRGSAAKQWLKAADSNSSWADVNSPERITT